MKSDRRLTDCMRLNLTCDPECERTVSHLQLPAPASCHRLPAGALASFSWTRACKYDKGRSK